MALEAENMSFDDLKNVTEGLVLRSITPTASPQLPKGSFDWLSFPFEDLNATAQPLVHFYDVIMKHEADIDWTELGRAYKDACTKHDLQLLPPPFGLKTQVPGNVQMQIVIIKDDEGHHSILKHISFPDKVKPVLVKSLVYGTCYRAKFMTGNPKVGRKILQYCLEGMGGRQFKCYELSSQAAPKACKNTIFDSICLC